MGKTYTLDLPTRPQTYIIAGDWHSFFLNLPTFKILLEYSSTLKKPWLIINGDFFDAPYLMKKDENFKKWFNRSEGMEEYFLPKLLEETEVCNSILDKCQKYFKDRIIFGLGNHDHRIPWFGSICPSAYAPHFDVASLLHFKKRGIKITYGYNDWLDIGDLSITHGMFHGSTCHKKHYEASGGRNVVFSHIHYDNKVSFMSRGKTKQVNSLPAISDLDPGYMKNQELNWTNGFGQANIKTNGHFNYYTHTVWDNQLIAPDGRIING